MAYTRVIPRDLFNEANLLKCWGQMYLNLEKLDLQDCIIESDLDGGFQIEQFEENGGIFLLNVALGVRGHALVPVRPLNSRRPYPMYIYQGDDEIEVFNDDGTFTDAMLAFLPVRAKP